MQTLHVDSKFALCIDRQFFFLAPTNQVVNGELCSDRAAIDRLAKILCD